MYRQDRGQNKMITIKEIAKALDVSTTTVSNVIHGKTKEVSPDTIQKVQKFLEEVEYVPNISARNLAQNESKIIGVVLKSRPDRYISLLQDPFVCEIISGMERAIRGAGYFMMVYMSDDIAEIISYISTWNVDGLILFCMLDDDGQRVTEKYRKPVVFMDTYADDMLKTYVNIGLDDRQGAYDAVKYLIECGHRKIGFLTDNRTGVDLERFRGYRAALKEAGIEYSDRNFLMLHTEAGEVERSLEKIVRKAENYTAVFCCSDLFAIQLMNALCDQGIRVPEDISVVGFDDNLYAKLHRPALTTVHQDAEHRGRRAAEILIDLLKGKKLDKNQIMMKPHLVIRDTVKKI